MQKPVIFSAFKRLISISFVWAILFFLNSCSLPVCCGPNAEPGSLQNFENVGKLDSPVIVVLIGQADKFIEQKKWPNAVSVLERALRINNRQSEVWSRMALVLLKQNKATQSIEMAKRSNSYAHKNSALQAANWSLISQAYAALKNIKKAKAAYKKAQQLKEIEN